MSYRLVFRRQIHSNLSALSSTDRYVRREFTLPFTPFDGLTVGCGDFHGTVSVRGEEGGVDAELTYDVETRTFTAWSDDKTIYRQMAYSQPTTPMEEILAQYIEMGWEVEPA